MFIKLAFLYLIAATTLPAQWQANGVAVCDTLANSGFYMLPKIAPDPNGGAYVAWRDDRNGSTDVYAQHISAAGKMLWEKNGIPIVQEANSQAFPRIIADGAGGAFIAWEDSRVTSTYIYGQRVDSGGRLLWGPSGIKVAETPGLFISLANDGEGGLLVAWNAFYCDTCSDVAVQRLDGSGFRVYADSGVRLSNRAGFVSANDVGVVSDDMGGAIVVWDEGRYQFEKVYAQRVDNNGRVLWAVNGVEVSDSLYNVDASISKDNSGGAMISWANLARSRKYLQRLGANGRPIWGSAVTLDPIAMGGNKRHTPDGRGGVFVGHSRWIQHVDTSGAQLWPSEGAAFTATPSGFTNSVEAGDPSHGVFNVWTYFTNSPSSNDIYVQYIDSAGQVRLGMNGAPVCNAMNIQDWPAVATDQSGSVIIVWDDFRGGHSGVYAVKIDSHGNITSIGARPNDPGPSNFHLAQNYPNPFNPGTTIAYELRKRGFVQMIIYDSVGREIIRLLERDQAAGSYEVVWDGKDSYGTRVSSGTYYYRLLVDGSVQLTKHAVLLK